MILTKKRAIRICIELWTYLAETGLQKTRWDGWKKYDTMDAECPFCEYGVCQRLRKGRTVCDYCPYHEKFGHCYIANSPYELWECASSTNTRKKYAKMFLSQLMEL